MSKEEKLAWKHYSSTIKLEGNEHPSTTELYERTGWISKDKDILNLLEDGLEKFEERIAVRILKSHPDKVVVNRCPNCDRLARTPYAMQCRHCHLDWHGK